MEEVWRGNVRARICAHAGALAVATFACPAVADYQAGIEAFNRADFAQVERAWTTAALQGDTRAQLQLGVMLLHGKRIKQDSVRAQILLRDASSRGNAEASYALYVAASANRRTPLSEAARLLEIAANQGSHKAARQLKFSRVPISRPGAVDPKAEADYYAPYVTALTDPQVPFSEAIRILEDGAVRGSRAAALHLDVVRMLNFPGSVGSLAVEQENWAPIRSESFAAPSVSAGEAIYRKACTVCHESGVAGAPGGLTEADGKR